MTAHWEEKGAQCASRRTQILFYKIFKKKQKNGQRKKAQKLKKRQRVTKNRHLRSIF